MRRTIERLAEYGWKPHRMSVVQKILSRAPFHWYMREKQGGYGFIEFDSSKSTSGVSEKMFPYA